MFQLRHQLGAALVRPLRKIAQTTPPTQPDPAPGDSGSKPAPSGGAQPGTPGAGNPSTSPPSAPQPAAGQPQQPNPAQNTGDSLGSIEQRLANLIESRFLDQVNNFSPAAQLPKPLQERFLQFAQPIQAENLRYQQQALSAVSRRAARLVARGYDPQSALTLAAAVDPHARRYTRLAAERTAQLANIGHLFHAFSKDQVDPEAYRHFNPKDYMTAMAYAVSAAASVEPTAENRQRSVAMNTLATAIRSLQGSTNPIYLQRALGDNWQTQIQSSLEQVQDLLPSNVKKQLQATLSRAPVTSR